MTSPRRPAVSVVVVSHSSGRPLLDCIERVLGQDIELELLLVDNGSTDGMAERAARDPRVRLLRNAGNPGFAVACNQGARTATSATLLFLNPDCLLPPGALRQLAACQAAAPQVGLLGARLLEADGRPQPAAIRPLPTLRRLLRPGDGRLGAALPGGLQAVEATSGALMWLPRAAFEAVGGFDEGYRLHCEDLDLCRRLAEAGWQIAIDPRLEVVHLKGESSRHRPFWVEWQKHRGMLRYLSRFERHGGWRLAWPLLWCAVWARYPVAALRAWWSARRQRRRLARQAAAH